jgi:hypothetical protein
VPGDDGTFTPQTGDYGRVPLGGLLPTLGAAMGDLAGNIKQRLQGNRQACQLPHRHTTGAQLVGGSGFGAGGTFEPPGVYLGLGVVFGAGVRSTGIKQV